MIFISLIRLYTILKYIGLINSQKLFMNLVRPNKYIKLTGIHEFFFICNLNLK